MPKTTINTLSNLFNHKVTAVHCEDGVISKNTAKKVSVFEKYSSKKSIASPFKQQERQL